MIDPVLDALIATGANGCSCLALAAQIVARTHSGDAAVQGAAGDLLAALELVKRAMASLAVTTRPLVQRARVVP